MGSNPIIATNVQMAKLANALVSKTSSEKIEGSIPSLNTFVNYEYMASWRNWHTHKIEDLGPKGLSGFESR